MQKKIDSWHVYAAVLRDDRVLILPERRESQWALPSGTVKGNEDREVCMRRALQERLDGVESVEFVFLWEFLDAYLVRADGARLSLYRADVRGCLRPGSETRRIAWVTADTGYPVTEVTRALLRSLKEEAYLS